VAVSVGIDDDIASADRKAVLAAFHKDLTGFSSFPEDTWLSWNYQDIDRTWFLEPQFSRWGDYDVFVSPDLAVIKGDRVTENPGTGSSKSFCTAIFQKQDGQWKLIHTHHSYGGP
jgi:ketosteroid isomerase-like protein